MSAPLDFSGYVAPDAPALFRSREPKVPETGVEFLVRVHAPIVVAYIWRYGRKWAIQEPFVGDDPTTEQITRMSAELQAAVERHGWIVERARSSRYWAQRLRFLTRRHTSKQGRSI